MSDGYRFLGEKSVAAVRWAVEHVRSDYVVKMDDDTFVHPQGLLRHLTQEHTLGEPLYGGALYRENPVLREGVWAIRPSERDGDAVTARSRRPRLARRVRAGVGLRVGLLRGDVGRGGVCHRVSWWEGYWLRGRRWVP